MSARAGISGGRGFWLCIASSSTGCASVAAVPPRLMSLSRPCSNCFLLELFVARSSRASSRLTVTPRLRLSAPPPQPPPAARR